jgi:outer membrane lipoprotein-sorting protein
MTPRHNRFGGFRRHDRPVLRTLSIAAALLLALSGLAAQDAAAPDQPAAQVAAPADQAAVPAAPADVVAPAPDAPAPDALMDQSREKLAGYKSLKAKMVETIDFGANRRFKADGLYLQSAGNKVRVDLAIEVGKNKGHLLQVSEGDVLWTVYDTGQTPKVTRRDVRQILAAAKGADGKSAVLAELGLGGLPALLAAIEQSIDFKPALAATIEGRKFYVLEGVWKPAFRTQFEAQVQQASEGPKSLPAQIPDMVRVYLDAETFFPYRIRYLKLPPAAGEEPRPLLTLDFRDIVVNAPIDPEEFRYTAPKDAAVADLTSIYVNQLQPGAAAAPAASPPAAPK